MNSLQQLNALSLGILHVPQSMNVMFSQDVRACMAVPPTSVSSLTAPSCHPFNVAGLPYEMHHEYSSYEVHLALLLQTHFSKLKKQPCLTDRIYLCWLTVVDSTCVNIKPLNLKKESRFSAPQNRIS
jgi:hypothetical protein